MVLRALRSPKLVLYFGYAVLFVAALHEIIVFTILYAEQPFATSFKLEEFNKAEFQDLIVCGTDVYVGPTQRRYPCGTKYARQYWRHNFHKNRTEAYARAGPVAEKKECLRKDMERAGVKTVTALFDADSGVGDLCLPEREECVAIRYLGKPIPTNTRKGNQQICFWLRELSTRHKGPHDTISISYEQDKLRLGDDAVLYGFEGKREQDRDPSILDKENDYWKKLFLGFYKGPEWYALSYEHFGHDLFRFPIAIREYVPVQQTSSWVLTLEKHEYLHRQKRPCTEVTSEVRYPLGLAKSVCETACEDAYFKQNFNCSWVSIFKNLTEDETDPFCNLYDISKQNNFADDRFRKELKSKWQKCVEENGCASKRFCTEWKIVFTAETKEFEYCDRKMDSGCDYKRPAYRTIIQFPSLVTVVREEPLINFQQWFGNIGGLTGVFTGVSLLTVWELVYRLWMKKYENTEVKEVEKGEEK